VSILFQYWCFIGVFVAVHIRFFLKAQMLIAIGVVFRSVLVLNGNGADVAKHAVPAVPTERYFAL